jgi:hypothetical protein
MGDCFFPWICRLGKPKAQPNIGRFIAHISFFDK